MKLFPKIIRVNVTKHDIKEGMKYSCYSCPIALALDRHKHKGITYPSVSFSYVTFEQNRWLRYSVPLKACDFIYNFDQGKRVKPFRFILKDPVLFKNYTSSKK